MKDKFIAMFKNMNKIGFTFLVLSIVFTLAATIVYACVDYKHPGVYVFTILSLVLSVAVILLCYFDILGQRKNILLIGVPILNIIALLVSIFGRLDVIGYWIDAKTPASSFQIFIASIALLAVCVVISVAAAVNGVARKSKQKLNVNTVNNKE